MTTNLIDFSQNSETIKRKLKIYDTLICDIIYKLIKHREQRNTIGAEQ